MTKDRILALIPARGGSKGIPHKNTVVLAHKPLMVWTIDAAKQAGIFDHIAVSSDDQRTLDIAKNNTVDLINRPKEISGDNATSESAVLHAIDYYKESLKKEFDYVVLLQPTSPLRTAASITEAVNVMLDAKANSLISVAATDSHLLKTFLQDGEGGLRGAVNDRFPFMPRQRLPKTYQANGAIYIVAVKEFIEQKTFLLKPCKGYLMPLEESIDIDCPEDLTVAEQLLEKKNNEND